MSLLTVQETADRLRITVPALRQMRYRGEGPPAVKLGKRVRFDATQLEEWLQEKYEEPK